MDLIKAFIDWMTAIKDRWLLRKRLKECRKKDPFIYR